MADAASTTATHRVEIFSAGCATCHQTIDKFRQQVDPHHDIVVHDLHGDREAAARADTLGIRSVPAFVVDGKLLACCTNRRPNPSDLRAAGIARADASS